MTLRLGFAAVLIATTAGFLLRPWDTLLVVYGMALVAVVGGLGWFAWWASVLADEKERTR